jgi:hypothetical protein
LSLIVQWWNSMKINVAAGSFVFCFVGFSLFSYELLLFLQVLMSSCVVWALMWTQSFYLFWMQISRFLFFCCMLRSYQIEICVSSRFLVFLLTNQSSKVFIICCGLHSCRIIIEHHKLPISQNFNRICVKII